MSYDWSGKSVQIHTVTQELMIAEKAEQRLARANELLREARDEILSNSSVRDEFQDFGDIIERIDSFLKECA